MITRFDLFNRMVIDTLNDEYLQQHLKEERYGKAFWLLSKKLSEWLNTQLTYHEKKFGEKIIREEGEEKT